MALNNSTGAVWLTFTNVGILQDGWGNPDLVSTNLSHALVLATPQTLGYDPDGNLTNDGQPFSVLDAMSRSARLSLLCQHMRPLRRKR